MAWQRVLAICLVAALVAAACSSSSTPTSGGTNAPKEPTGTLTVAVASTEENFLPSTGSAFRKTYYDPLYDYLLYASHDKWELKPGLAEKWTVSPDQKTWTFELRDGVTFNGGNGALIADDVKFSYELMQGRDSVNAYAAPLRNTIDKIQILSPRKIQFDLKIPYASFGVEMASSFGPVSIVSKAYVERVGAAVADRVPVGSGPYILKERRSGESMTFEAVGAHWRVTPEFKQIVVRIVPEDATRVALAQRGDVDITVVPISLLSQLKDAKGKLIESFGDYSTLVVLGGLVDQGDKRYTPDMANTPLRDVRVREALNLAVDRKAIIDKIYLGHARAAVISDQVPGWESLAPIPYDVARAKQLLAAAGYVNGFELRMPSYPMSPGAELPEIAQAVSTYWSAIGVRTSIQPTDFATWRTSFTAAKTTGAAFGFRYPRSFDYGLQLQIAHQYAGAIPTYSDARIQSLLQELSGTVDLKAKEVVYAKIAQHLREQWTTVPIAVVNGVFFQSARISTWTPLAGKYAIYLEYARHAPALNLPRTIEP